MSRRAYLYRAKTRKSQRAVTFWALDYAEGEREEREGGVCAVREGGKVHTENDGEGHFDGLDLGLRNDTMRDASALTSIRSGVHQDTAGRRTAVSTRRTCAHQPAPRAALSIW